MLWGMEQADVVKLSREELKFLLNEDGPEAARQLLEDYGLKLLFVTLGERGCYFTNGSCCGRVQALGNLCVRDTTGAGDIFFGAVLSRLLAREKAPEQLTETELCEDVTFACTAAGLSVERPGGLSSIPNLEEVYRRMEG